MEVNDLLIDNLARLARLEFNGAERDEIKVDLQRMISFVDKLNEIDTTGIEPLLHMSTAMDVLRDDTARGSVTQQQGLRNAPDTDGTYFLVPKVINTPSK